MISYTLRENICKRYVIKTGIQIIQKTLKSTTRKQFNKKWTKNLNRHLFQEHIKLQISIFKDALHHVSSGSCKLEQRGTSTHVLELSKPQHWQHRCWWGCGATGSLIHCQWKCKTAQSPWRTFGGFLQNWIYSYMIQQSCYLTIIQRSWKFMSTQSLAHRGI